MRNMEVTIDLDRFFYKVGCAGLLITAFCFGWNLDHFKKPK